MSLQSDIKDLKRMLETEAWRSEKDTCARFDVSPSTLRDWVVTNPSIMKYVGKERRGTKVYNWHLILTTIFKDVAA